MSFTTPSLWAQKGNETVSKWCCDVEIRHFPRISCIQSYIYTSKCMYKYVIVMNNMETPEIESISNWNNSNDLRWGRQMHPVSSDFFDQYLRYLRDFKVRYFQYASNSISWASKTITLDLTNDVKFNGLDLKQEMHLKRSWIIEPESILQRLA